MSVRQHVLRMCFGVHACVSACLHGQVLHACFVCFRAGQRVTYLRALAVRSVLSANVVASSHRWSVAGQSHHSPHHLTQPSVDQVHPSSALHLHEYRTLPPYGARRTRTSAGSVQGKLNRRASRTQHTHGWLGTVLSYLFLLPVLSSFC